MCKDPVAGTWKSHSYDEVYRDWTIFTLDMRRVEGTDTFEGTITNESWIAAPNESSPPKCQGDLHYVISMDAEGKVDADNGVQIWGVGTWRLDEVPCGNWNMGYNLDHFSGTIDPEIMEFQSVNNDGGRSVNDPVVFRRVRCGDGQELDEEPRITVAPPPFVPPDEEGGCGVR